MHFWSFGPNIGLSDQFGAVPDPNNNANEVLRWFLPQNMPKKANFGALSAHLVPYWLVGWWLWRAGCILQDTYLLYGENH